MGDFINDILCYLINFHNSPIDIISPNIWLGHTNVVCLSPPPSLKCLHQSRKVNFHVHVYFYNCSIIRFWHCSYNVLLFFYSIFVFHVFLWFSPRISNHRLGLLTVFFVTDIPIIIYKNTQTAGTVPKSNRQIVGKRVLATIT